MLACRTSGTARGAVDNNMPNVQSLFICVHVMYVPVHCSSWDEYAAEVKSGRLEWSPVHRSDKFWVRQYYQRVGRLSM